MITELQHIQFTVYFIPIFFYEKPISSSCVTDSIYVSFITQFFFISFHITSVFIYIYFLHFSTIFLCINATQLSTSSTPLTFFFWKTIVCKYTVHERCVQRCAASCITTYSKRKTKGTPVFHHHFTEGNCYGRCSKCRKRIKAYHGITGLTCRWCRMTVSAFFYIKCNNFM